MDGKSNRETRARREDLEEDLEEGLEEGLEDEMEEVLEEVLKEVLEKGSGGGYGGRRDVKGEERWKCADSVYGGRTARPARLETARELTETKEYGLPSRIPHGRGLARGH